MDKLPSCNLPWIGTVVDTFATTTSSLPTAVQTSSSNKAAFAQCCDAPGQCRFLAEGHDSFHDCNSYGIVFCVVGNSKYICELFHHPTNKTVPTAIAGINHDIRVAEHCRQEGTLTSKRSIPCCPTHLSRFLKSKQPCYPRFDEYGRMEDIICQPGDGGQCETSTNDWNELSWRYPILFQGEHTLIVPGYAVQNQTDTLSGRELQCIEEIEFGTRADGNTTCVPVVESSCNDAGGNRPDNSNNSKGKPNGGVSSVRRRQGAYRRRGGFAKNIALLVFTPLLLQMLFL